MTAVPEPSAACETYSTHPFSSTAKAAPSARQSAGPPGFLSHPCAAQATLEQILGQVSSMDFTRGMTLY